ncbi:MAG: hypothetical protein K1X89_03755 [Myxococcaceae bacterium]|nr:hypothetical protein [Myxococcaceae bacterium]
MKRALLCLLLAGCGEAFLPETVVVDLRVLGVKAEPAELRPGEAATLTALVKDPTRSAPPTIVWLGCDPDPFGQGRSACSNPTVLQDLASAGSSGMLPVGVHLIGFNDQARYAVSKDLFSVLPEGDPRRLKGTVGQVLALAVADTVPPDQLGEVFKKVQSGEVKAVVTLFRIVVREGEMRNTNPVPARLLVGGEAIAPGAHALVKQGEDSVVALEATEASFEPYTQTQPDGTVESKTERLISAWYSTSGRFSQPRLALDSDVEDRFSPPGGEEPKDPLPERREGQLYVVLRDARGGNAFRESAFYVCDEGRARPVVRTVSTPSTRDDVVVLEGEHLEQLLDVVAGPVALEQPFFDAASGRWSGRIPKGLVKGEYPLGLRGKDCSRTSAPVSLVVP